MKKNYFYLLGIALVTMLSVSFVSCGKDKEEDKDDMIDTTPISLAVGSEKIITGADTIVSSNRFVAYGTKNTVKAYHVGETSLLVNGKKTISISVYSTNYLYDNPVCEWGCSMDYVKSHQKQGTYSSKSTNEYLLYENAGGASGLAYSFENGALVAVLAFVSTNHTSTLGTYLAERYLMLPIYQGEKTYFAGIDAIDTDNAKTLVYMDVYNTKFWSVLYMKYDKNSTRSSIDDDMVRKELIEQVASFIDN
jgi:hypothetical protein